MERGQPPGEAAERFEVHPATARRWRREAAAGVEAPRVGGATGRHTKLTEADLLAMRAAVNAKPGVTARELAARVLGGRVVESTVCRAMKKMGLRLKKRPWPPASS
jgi:transposase